MRKAKVKSGTSELIAGIFMNKAGRAAYITGLICFFLGFDYAAWRINRIH